MGWNLNLRTPDPMQEISRRKHREHFGCSKSHCIKSTSKPLVLDLIDLFTVTSKTHLFLHPFAGIAGLAGRNSRHRNENDSVRDIQRVCFALVERSVLHIDE